MTPGLVRFLKLLVTVLTVTMIIGVVTIVALLINRLQDVQSGAIPWPDEVGLPEGVQPLAVTRGPGWIAVVAEDEILILDLDGQITERISVSLP